MEGEFQDWELLHNSDTAPVPSPVSDRISGNLEEIEGETLGVFRSDYFSLDNQSRYLKSDDVTEEGSVESDNPSWIDPGTETRYARKHSGEFWSDSGSDRSDERKLGDFYVKNELSFVDNAETKVELEGDGQVVAESENSAKFACEELEISDFHAKNCENLSETEKNPVNFENFGEIQVEDKDMSEHWSDSGGVGLASAEFVNVEKEEGMNFGGHLKKAEELAVLPELDDGSGSKEETQEMEGGEGTLIGHGTVTIGSGVQSGGEEEKRNAVAWWKVPFEILKYCVFKVSPVWSLSVAAAVMGFVILGRRLYKMKRKTRSLQLNVTMDDKKVSQFMSRAVRLNEAFSVVRRVPIIRPALPAAGVNTWPVMSLR
ncbi:uncharacterized protein LOC110818759 isoform X1 [Carica papaya]|uniref:uncharacterized protein LOC110818759 isoform X1 n=1 Tax=Carica papaya TaxID=3649 RepID=UPI000B8C786B|nr:uncharacterized protein LOC110818759 isoform X1 [Carica papaya]